ncbi:phage tail tape measure protein [Streptomyces caeni]|uniref:Phage tail tape measure protein n=1 Tax=Streptomyces caeni TaxID=2307231 RepID=A0ABW4II51_9ACTN
MYDLIARDHASRTFRTVGDAATRLQRQGSGVGAAIATGLKVGTVAAGGLAIASLKAAGDFEKSMNQVRAVSGATGKDFQDLRNQAKQLGATTKFSASQAADGMGFLAMAGFRAKDIMSAMPGVLSLASAGNMDLARSADIASNILTGYGFKATQTGKIVDVLAKTFTSTNTDLEQLGEAFKYAGPVAHSAGIKFEESAAAIGLMGNAGIQASMAGTSLRGAITRLLAPTDKIKGVLDQLGVKVVDSHDKMLPLADIIEQLGKKGATTSDLMTIFGQRAGPAMAALIDQGAPALRHLTKQLDNAGGTADKIAKVQMEGLQGQLTSLKSAWEGLMIEIGDLGVLKLATTGIEGITTATRGLTGYVDKYARPALGAFKTTLGNLVPVDKIKQGFSDAKTAVGDFFKGLVPGKAPALPTPMLKAPQAPAAIALPTLPASDSQKMGESIRKALEGGISNLDWGKLGSTLGKGLSSAIGWVGQHTADLTKKLADVIGKIDFVQVGKAFGSSAIPLAIGFITNLFEPLFSLDFWKKHWLDTIIAVVSIIPIGRLAGGLAKVVGKIPFLRVFEPLLKGVSKLGGWIEKGFGKFVLKPLGKFGKAILDGIVRGFTRVFPGAKGKLGEFIGKMALNIVGYAGRFAGAGERLIKGLGSGILKLGGTIGEWIGRIIGWLTKPFAKAGSWLVGKGRALVTGLKDGAVSIAKGIGSWVWRNVGSPLVARFARSGSWLYSKGRALVTGLKNGVVSIARSIGSWTMSHVISPVTTQFARAGSWLYSKGASLISGLKNGIVGAVKGIGSWLKKNLIDPVVNAVKHFFGIRSPSRVFMGIGGHLVAGLMKGLARTSGNAIAHKVFGSLPKALASIVKKGLVSITSLPGRALKALGGLGGDILGLLGLGGGGGGSSANQKIGQTLAAAYGWSGPQWAALKNLWTGESGWNERALNKSSGAYGIPQALPASKMASAGSDWRTSASTQIKWGLGYIKSRYGNPVNAYSAWLSRSPHWYDAGGIARGRGYMPKATLRPERVLSPRQTEAFERMVAVLERDHGQPRGGDTYTTSYTVNARTANFTPRDLERLQQQSEARQRVRRPK